MAPHRHVSEKSLERRKVRIGVRLTLLYFAIYGGFVALSVFRPAAMAIRTAFGLNLAVAYGLGLILVAILFALIYNELCRVRPGRTNTAADEGE